MAALTITPANIVLVSGTPQSYTSGATLTAGQAVYLDTAANTVKLADANLSAAAAVLLGVTLHASLSGQPISVAGSGCVVAFGAILTAAETYVLGATAAGDINPVTDLTTGWYVALLGYGLTTSNMQLNIVNYALAHA